LKINFDRKSEEEWGDRLETEDQDKCHKQGREGGNDQEEVRVLLECL